MYCTKPGIDQAELRCVKFNKPSSSQVTPPLYIHAEDILSAFNAQLMRLHPSIQHFLPVLNKDIPVVLKIPV